MKAVVPEGSLGSWETRAIVATMIPVLVGLSILEMGSGVVLEVLEETFLEHPTLFVLVPVMIDMGGNLGAIMSSRLSTRLHLGTLDFSLRDDVIQKNVAAVMMLASTIFVLMGLAAYGVGHLSYAVGFAAAPPMELSTLLVISFVSGMILAVLAVALSLGATYVSYNLGVDPDDTTIPVVTNVCDILGVIVLSGVAILVL